MKLKPFLFLLLLLPVLGIGTAILTQCKKEPDTTPTRPPIEGHWGNLLPVHPDWQYDLKNNLLTQYIVDLGDTLTTLQYPYAIRNDTVFIGGDLNSPKRWWKWTSHCDSVAEVRNITPGTMLAPVLYLKRLE